MTQYVGRTQIAEYNRWPFNIYEDSSDSLLQKPQSSTQPQGNCGDDTKGKVRPLFSLLKNIPKNSASNSSTLNRGKMILPSFSRDQNGREEFWDMLIGKKKLKRVSLFSDVDAKDSDDLVPIDSSLLFRPWKNEQDSSVDREDAKSDHSSIRAEIESKLLDEMTQCLRSLLGLDRRGDLKLDTAPKEMDFDLERTDSVIDGDVESLDSAPSLFRDQRQPQPPPFSPSFLDIEEGEDVLIVK